MIQKGSRLVIRAENLRSIRTLILVIAAALPGFSVAATRPNIILVSLESMRSDRVGFMGSKIPTPSLNALAKQSIVFERAYAQTPVTISSHATILSGTYPQTHQVSEMGIPLAPTLPYLPDLLHARGYRTAAFVGSIELDPHNGFAQGFDRGFDTYDAGFNSLQPGDKGTSSSQRNAAQVVARAISWVNQNRKGPLFLWVHLNDPAARSAVSYDRAVTAADAALGKLLSALRTANLYDESAIVVAADHGESMGAHGEDTHGVFLYDETIRVPLLVKLPGKQLDGKRIRGRVRLLDIAPSILETAGIPVPSQMQGQSLLRIAKGNPDADQAVYSRSDFPQQAFGWSVVESWRTGKYLYVRSPKPELYDLSADPGASHNLAQSSKAILETMAAQLSAFNSRFGARGKTTTPGLSSSEMEKLASLGYVGLQKPSSAADTSVKGTDPKDVIGIANKTASGMKFLDEGKRERAIALFRDVLTSQPNIYLAQYGLGTALAQQQQYADAIQHLHKAIELHPESAWAQYEMGLCLTKTGDFKASAVHLEIASSRLPSFPALHLLLANVYERLGRKDDAQRERAKAAQAGRG
jgi:arylsulfatase A-like enzyme/Tfp pilus assembly protein PilF